jgi:hypothetical protein
MGSCNSLPDDTKTFNEDNLQFNELAIKFFNLYCEFDDNSAWDSVEIIASSFIDFIVFVEKAYTTEEFERLRNINIKRFLADVLYKNFNQRKNLRYFPHYVHNNARKNSEYVMGVRLKRFPRPDKDENKVYIYK